MKRIELNKDYMMLACEDQKTVSLYKTDSAKILSRILLLTDVERNDARMMTYSDTLSVVLYTKSYPWTSGQTQPLTFIDTVAVMK